MNILLVNWRDIRNPEAGGAEVHLHEIFRRVAAAGHRVTLVSAGFPKGASREMIDGIDTRRIGVKVLFHLQFKRHYMRTLVREPFDLVVDDISKIPLNTPRYVTPPVVAILHHLHQETLFQELFWPAAYYIIRRERLIPRYYSTTPMFTVSESTRREIIALGQPPDMTDLLYNAIDHRLFSQLRVPKAKDPLITYVGRVKRYKRIEMIVDAVAILRPAITNLRLHIAGGGDHLADLRAYVVRRGLEGVVTVSGSVSEQEKAEAMSRAWLFVTASQKEGWGITVIEANAAGTPVVAFRVPGLRDSVVHGETGILVDQQDAESLAAAMEPLLQDPESLAAMGVKARQWASRFTWEASAEHFLARIGQWFPHLVQG